MRELPRGEYTPIEDYGAIGNLRTTALVSRTGSIDWCCLPYLDNASTFAALLDHRRGGRFRICPHGGTASEHRYIEDTNVLETRIAAPNGVMRLTDFMPLRGSITGMDVEPVPAAIHRWVECEEGSVHVEVEWSPRPGYAFEVPHIEADGDRYVAGDGDERVVLFGLRNGSIGRDDFGPVVRATIELAAGDRLLLVSRHGADDTTVDGTASHRSLEHTIAAWREWSDTCRDADRALFGGRWHDQVCRSALALKLLTLPDTGAIAAAATTSLPEEIGGVRNWDYRFCWIRDAAFTAQALVSLGHRAEALDYLAFMSHVCGEQLASGHGPQILYGLHGETEVKERVLEHLEGYRGSRPVRTGNAAAEQLQHDVYGELLGAAYELARIGGEIPADVWRFLSDVTDRAAVAWRYPDAGIWEVRTAPRHHVYSKVMVWVALDRAIRMTERLGMPGNADEWRDARQRVREAVLEEGYDPEVGAFVQSFGSDALDAANLLIPIVGFLPFDDPRVQGTIDRTIEQLTDDGLVYRYLTDDGLPGGEGTFLLTTFWLVDALALSGRMAEAQDIFEATAKRANRLGLYAEEYDPRTGTFLGNYPQGFSHIGFINSALYLARAAGRKGAEPAPMGSREHREEAGHDPGAAA